MIRTSARTAVFIGFGLLTVTPIAMAQSSDTPMTRLRPIGSPSAVDQYRAPSSAPRYRETAYQPGAMQPGNPQRQASGSYDSGVRQTVLLQQFDAPQLPGAMPVPGNFAPPPVTAAPNPVPMPSQAAAPRGLPVIPGNLAPVPLDPSSGRSSSNSDYVPLAQPQLNDGFATIDNCACISGPGNYVSATGWGGCAPVSYQSPQAYVAPPTQIAAPSILPNGFTQPQGAGIPRGALISFGQASNPVQVGQGIIGQPVAYVPGQRLRNWIRYIFP